jgi:hypothetical protein
MNLSSLKIICKQKESLLIAGFLLFFLCKLSSQNTFNKTFSFQNHREEISSIINISGDYFFVGGSLEENSSNDLVKMIIIKTNSDGELLDTLNYQFDTLSFGIGTNVHNLIFYDSTIYISSVLKFQNSTNLQDGALVKFKDFDVLPTYEIFTLDSGEVFMSLYSLHNNFLIFGQTNTQGNGQADYYLLKSDTIGNLLADTTLGGMLFEQIGNAIKINDNHYVFCGLTSTFANVRQYFNVPAANAQFIAVDSNFNVLWDQVLYSSGVDIVPMIKDYGFFYSSVEHPILPPPSYRDDYVRLIGQLDVFTGSLLWRDTIKIEEEIIAKRFFETVDSNSFIVFCEVESPSLPYSYAKILKYSNQGELIWQRAYYEGNHNGCYLNTMIVDDEGYLVFGGSIANLETQSQDAWLLKLRPDGCLNDEDCGIISGLIDLTPQRNKFQMLVSPNPSSGLAQIIVENTVGFKGKDLLLQVFDVNSKLIYQETKNINGALPIINIDISTQPSGTYYIQAVVEGVSLGEGKLVLVTE